MHEVVSYKKVFQGSTMEIYYASNHIMYADWHGYNTLESVKEGATANLDYMIKYDCFTLLNDHTRILGTYNQALKWMETNLMPRFAEAGIKRIAHIYSPDKAANYSGF